MNKTSIIEGSLAVGAAYGAETAYATTAAQFVSTQVTNGIEFAKPFAEKAITNITPYLTSARDTVAPYVTSARDTVAPYVTSAVDTAAPYFNTGYEKVASVAGQAMEKASPYFQQVADFASPYLKTVVDVASPYFDKAMVTLQPAFDAVPSIVDAAKNAPSASMSANVAGLTGLGIVGLYKVQRFGTDYMMKRFVGESIDTFLPTQGLPAREGGKPVVNFNHRINRSIRFVADYGMRATQLSIAAALTYYAGLQLGTALTLSQVFKVTGTVVATMVLCEVAKLMVKGTIATMKVGYNGVKAGASFVATKTKAGASYVANKAKAGLSKLKGTTKKKKLTKGQKKQKHSAQIQANIAKLATEFNDLGIKTLKIEDSTKLDDASLQNLLVELTAATPNKKSKTQEAQKLRIAITDGTKKINSIIDERKKLK